MFKFMDLWKLLIQTTTHSNIPSAGLRSLWRFLWEATRSKQAVLTGNIENTLRSWLWYWSQPFSTLASILDKLDLLKSVFGFGGQIKHLKQLKASVLNKFWRKAGMNGLGGTIQTNLMTFVGSWMLSVSVWSSRPGYIINHKLMKNCCHYFPSAFHDARGRPAWAVWAWQLLLSCGRILVGTLSEAETCTGAIWLGCVEGCLGLCLGIRWRPSSGGWVLTRTSRDFYDLFGLRWGLGEEGGGCSAGKSGQKTSRLARIWLRELWGLFMPRHIETKGYVRRFGMGLTLEGHEVTEGWQRETKWRLVRPVLRFRLIPRDHEWLALGRGDSEG